MQAPTYEAPPIDPATLSAEQMAQSDQINAMRTRTQGDSASLMAQYGILAMAANTGASAPPPPTAGSFGGLQTGTSYATAGSR